MLIAPQLAAQASLLVGLHSAGVDVSEPFSARCSLWSWWNQKCRASQLFRLQVETAKFWTPSTAFPSQISDLSVGISCTGAGAQQEQAWEDQAADKP